MKKILCITLAALLLFGTLTACNKTPQQVDSGDVTFEESMSDIEQIGELLAKAYRAESMEERQTLVEEIAELRFGGSFIPSLVSEEELLALTEELAALDAAYKKLNPDTDMQAMEENLSRQFEILLQQLYNDQTDFIPAPAE